MTSPEPGLDARLAHVLDRIRSAERRFGRAGGSVGLLAVSKTQPATAVRAVAAHGQSAFGENYLQEALDKRTQLADLPLAWHFIGPVQSNKTRRLAEAFDWVHTVDRLKIAERLSAQRPDGLAPLSVCIEVNIDGEPSKSGVPLAQLPALAHAVAALPRLQLRGLMAIPAPANGFDAQRRPHARLRAAFEALRRDGLALDTLSIGMSDDLEAAIAEGATLVRVGTAIFGPRKAPA